MKKIVLLSAAVLAFAACGQKKTEQVAVEPVQEVLPKVEVCSAVRQLVPQDQVYTSTVVANISNNIVPQTAGRIVKINVEVGDFVQKGQILAEMDKVNLEQATLRLANEEKELKRIKQLFEEGGVSQSDYDAMVLSFNVSKTSYENLLENTILRSPVDGVITSRGYDCGDMYAMASPIFNVQQITPVKLYVAISETDYTKVQKGDKVQITADAIPGRTFTGTINRIHPTVDSSTHTFNVEVVVPNKGRELRPGMFVRAKVTFAENNNVVVPDVAVVKLQGSGQRLVYVLCEDGTVDLKVVGIGRHFDGKYEILSGLEEGEKVVVKGHTALREGVKVEVL